MKLFCLKSRPHHFRVFRVFRGLKTNSHGPLFSLRPFVANRTRPHRPFTFHVSRFRSLSVLCLLIAVLCAGVAAAGFSKTFSLSAGEVVVTNNQKRSSWHPVALLFHFTESVDSTISVKRLSNEHEFLLSTITLTNVQDVTWIPDADYPFNYGDALVISTTATSGTLELIQRSD